MNRITLVTGGARSGKSRYALEAALGFEKRVFVATAVAFDEGMRERIAAHQAERADRFTTVEEPHDLAGALGRVPPDTDVVLIDCLTVWLGNLMHRHDGDGGTYPEIASFLECLQARAFNTILVTNEVGAGIVPENGLARRFRDLAGRLNQDVARIADSVVLTVCGIPTAIKGAL